MVPHGQFYCHFHKIKIRTAELSCIIPGKIVMGFDFRLIQSISGIKSQNKNIVEKWRLTWLKYVYWLFLQPTENQFLQPAEQS
jgi:hypothetical protein